VTLDLPTREDETRSDAGAAERVRQWRGESIQLVDWGNMSGHVQLDLNGESALITGLTGSGKSTILDAVLAIMQPSRTRFNSASNSSGVGRARSGDQRDELSYLIGKFDDLDREDGETISRALRPVTGTSRWGALAMTFRSNFDEWFTLVRAYFVPRGASHRNDLTQRCATIDGPFDLRRLQEAASSRFEMRAMRTLGLHPYDGPGPFHDAMCKRLGFGTDGAGVVDLLRRIQAGDDVTSVNHLFSSTVLEDPETFKIAKNVTDSFEGLRSTYNEMKTVAAVIAALSGIPEHKAELDAVNAELADLDALRLAEPGVTPFAVWKAHTEHERRNAALERASAALPLAETARADADVANKRAARQVRKLETALDDENAGLSALKDDIEDAQQNLRRIESNRGRFDDVASALGTVVTTADEHAALLARGSALGEDIAARRKQLQERTVELGGEQRDLRLQKADLDREIESLENRSGRVPEHLDTIRNQIARRLGWGPTKLPFIAELIDVSAEHEEWRTAAEAVLGSTGIRLVVPAHERRRFQHAVNDLRLGRRVKWDFATTDAPLVDAHDRRRLISRLEFAQDAQFLPWLINRVNRAGGRHLCVDTVEELAIVDGESRVVRTGQVSERTSGSHGGGQERILGFSNDDLIAEKRQRLDQVLTKAEQIAHELADIDRDNGAMDDEIAHVKALQSFADWSELDVATATARHDHACARLDELRLSSDRIPVLEKQLTQAQEQAKATSRALVGAEDAVTRLGEEITLQENRLQATQKILDRSARGEVGLTDAQRTLCDAAAERVGLSDGTERLDETFELVRQNLADQITPLQQRRRRATLALESAFSNYRSQWGDAANDSADVSAYPEYLQILEAQQARGLESVRNDWCAKTVTWSADDLLTLRLAFRDAREDIKSRIVSISDLLATVPFGAADDRLQLKVEDRIPPEVLSWLRDLQELANNITGLDTIEDPEQRFLTIEARFTRIDALIDKIRIKPRNTSEDTMRNAILDVRRQVYIKAHRISAETGAIIATHNSFAAKSGGESQALTAFITGAALRFRLGSTDSSQTTYTPVFLDEGFIKADGQHTSQAVKAWEALGFQLIVAAPVDKFSAIEPYLKRLFMVSKDPTGRGYCDQLTADEVRAQLELGA
jgi:uncharacterized protein YPO0396